MPKNHGFLVVKATKLFMFPTEHPEAWKNLIVGLHSSLASTMNEFQSGLVVSVESQ